MRKLALILAAVGVLLLSVQFLIKVLPVSPTLPPTERDDLDPKRPDLPSAEIGMLPPRLTAAARLEERAVKTALEGQTVAGSARLGLEHATRAEATPPGPSHRSRLSQLYEEIRPLEAARDELADFYAKEKLAAGDVLPAGEHLKVRDALGHPPIFRRSTLQYGIVIFEGEYPDLDRALADYYRKKSEVLSLRRLLEKR